MKDRGKGIKINHTFDWAKQPDGKYTIFNVPIMKPFERNKLKVSRDDLGKVIATFEEDIVKGHYPRLQLGHQDFHTTKNAKGVGYIDNLQLGEDTIYADFTDIKDVDFSNIEQYPYRSVEINVGSFRIESLALLESRMPFFVLPMLALSKEEITPVRESVLAFERRSLALVQLGGKSVYTSDENKDEKEDGKKAEEKKEEGKENLKEEVKDKPKEKVEDIKEEKETVVKAEGEGHEGEPHAKEEMLFLKGIQDSILSLTSLVRELHGALIDVKDKPTMEEKDIAKPSSVAQNQADPLAEMREMQKSMQLQLDEMKGLRASAQCSNRLKEISDENPAIQFEAHSLILDKFSSEEDKNVYLDSLALNVASYPSHFASFVAGKAPVHTPKEELTSKLKEAKIEMTPELTQLSRRVQKDYWDTLGQTNQGASAQFAAQYPTEFDYVRTSIQNEIDIPGSYDRM